MSRDIIIVLSVGPKNVDYFKDISVCVLLSKLGSRLCDEICAFIKTNKHPWRHEHDTALDEVCQNLVTVVLHVIKTMTGTGAVA